MISLKHKCIFIEVPKTASTSIRQVLGLSPKPHLDIKEYRNSLKINSPFQTVGYKYINPLYTTFVPKVLKTKIGDSVFNSFFKFGFVRNPWSRTVSLYFRNEALQKKRQLTFEEFVDWIQYSSDTCIHSSIKKYQLDWFTDDNGEIIVDYIGKFETINTCWNYITKKLNIKDSLPHINNNNFISRKHYTEYYNSKTKAIIRNKFLVDINHFKYEFES